MQNKALRRNVLASVACAATTTHTSANQENTWGRGIRFYVTLSSVTAAGGTDALYLCGVPPSLQTSPLAGTPIQLTGFTGTNLLSAAGTFCFDFYPGAWLPGSGMATGKLLGVAGVELPLCWAVAVVMGTGNAATIQIDAEILP